MSENVAKERWAEAVIRRLEAALVVFCLSVFSITGSAKAESGAVNKKVAFRDEAVSRKVLENGLIVLSAERPSRGLVSIAVKIKAGSSLEGEYLGSGISHLVEHMVFKGTKTLGPGEIEKRVKSFGGFLNGSVSQDLTDFRVTVPAKHFNETIRLLKDMLLNARFDAAEFDKEKEVIRNEIRFHNDEPQSRISRLLNETSYITHPYKYPPIGYEAAFLGLSREDAVKYYNKMYCPNRMVISVVGDISEADARNAIEASFKDFRPANYGQVDVASSPEPAQLAKRELEEERPIGLSYLAIGFHSTRLLDEDLFSMDVLAMVLGRGNNSRLNNSLLKDKRLAYSVSCWNYTPRDPGLFVISASLDREKMAGCEASVMDEINRVLRGSIGDGELEAAKRMVLADYIFSREGIDEEANDLALNYILTGSHNFSRRYCERVQSVSKDDVRRAANRYLKADNLTVVRLLPLGSIRPAEKGRTALPAQDNAKKAVLPNGLRVIVKEDKKVPAVSVTVAAFGGLMVEDAGTNGISHFTSRMLLSGTKARREEKIKGAIEALGGSISAFSGFNGLGIKMEFLKPDLDASLEILKDVLTNSIFPQAEIDREKALTLAMIKAEEENIFQKGINLARKGVFGGTPYAMRFIGEEGTIKSFRREELIDFYKDHFIANNMVIAIAGDCEPESTIDKLKKLFGDLKAGKEIPLPVKTNRPAPVKSQSVEMDKEESLVLAGFLTTGSQDPDRYALEVLSSVLSGSSGRLFAKLRNEVPLGYSLGCFQKTALDTGFFVFYIATTKERIAEAKKALEDEVGLIGKAEVGEEELAIAKRELATANKLSCQSNSFFSSNSALDELYGLGYDTLYKYESEVDKVTREDLKRVANKYFDLSACAWVVIAS